MYIRTLRNRIVAAFVVFGLTLSVTLSVMLYTSFHTTEDVVVKDAMRAELALGFEPEAAGRASRHQLEAMTVYSTSIPGSPDLPARFRVLGPGYHHLEFEGRQYRVLVEDRADQRYVVSYDETQMQRRDRHLLLGLAGSTVLAFVLSTWIGFLIARRVIRPVSQLTSDIGALESGERAGVEPSRYADDEVGMLARAFQQYHERLNALMEREREFAGNVSHELRTPVTSINLAAEVLAEDTTMSEKQRFRLQRIRRAGREMSEMINTFLLLSRHEGEGEGDVTDCDVNATVREIAEDQRVWIGDKPVSTRVIEDAQLTVRAPRGVVAVLVGNIVRNAYRYTKSGLVTVRITEDRVIVEDTGPGIDAETRAHMFERNVHGAAGDHGTGLGLSIVRRLCERYGWRVEVSSTLGSGSRFDLILRPA